MGTKIQDYDLEQGLREITKDIREARIKFGKDIQVLLEEMVTGLGENTDAIETLEGAVLSLGDGLGEAEDKIAALEGMVGYSSAGETDDEVFTYDPVTDDIIKHEVLNGGVLKYQIEYSYQGGNISQAVKTYTEGTDTVTVTTTFTYNQKGNVSGMSHRRTVTPQA